MMPANLLHPDWIERISWALLHFAWQGFVIAGTVAIVFRCCNRSRPATRYAIGVSFLTLMLLTPLFTFAWLLPPPSIPIVQTHQPSQAPIQLLRGDSETPLPARPTQTVLPRPVLTTTYSPLHLVIVLFWLGGQVTVGMRIWISIFFFYRVRRLAEPLNQTLCEATKRIATHLQLRHCPPVLKSELVTDAVAAGLIRRCVILPASWLTEMSPEMVEAIIAHELAHIQRHDLWVNLFQRLVETMLFFHPAVWWLSGRIRTERELCCDALAAQVTSKRLYAKTLEQVARKHHSRPSLMVAHIGEDRMSLLARVRFVLGESPRTMRSTGWWPAGLMALAIPIAIAYSTMAVEGTAQEKKGVKETQAAGPPAEFLRLASTASHIPKHPTELSKVSLPDYIVEPPDILLLKLVSGHRRTKTYRLQLQDQLSLVLSDNGRTGERRVYSIQSDGTIDLGPLGRVGISGLTLVGATEVVREAAKRAGQSGDVQLGLLHRDAVMVAGEHLVGPDGTMNLGIYGRVYVAGKTIDEVKTEVERTLGDYFIEPTVQVDVFVYNSKFFYVIHERLGWQGDSVVRIPATGNETVLDAIAQVGGLDVPTQRIHIARPVDGAGASVQILPVDWEAISEHGDTATNFQILPGDRLFISERPKPNDTQRTTDPTSASLLLRYNELVAEKRFDEAQVVAQNLEGLLDDSVRQIMKQHFELSIQVAKQNDDVPAPSGAIYASSYYVGDLVVPISPIDLAKAQVDPNTSEDLLKRAESADFETLIELIRTSVAPNSWDDVGGLGSMAPFEGNLSLVVSNTQEVHDEIADIFAQLRQLREATIHLRIVPLNLHKQVLERLGLHNKRFAALSGAEQQRLLKHVVLDPHSRLFGETEVSLFDGQPTTMTIGDEGTASTFRLSGSARGDAIQFSLVNEDDPSHDISVQVQAGETLLVGPTPDETSSPTMYHFRLITIDRVTRFPPVDDRVLGVAEEVGSNVAHPSQTGSPQETRVPIEK